LKIAKTKAKTLLDVFDAHPDCMGTNARTTHEEWLETC
jgi:hypothetical protein